MKKSIFKISLASISCLAAMYTLILVFDSTNSKKITKEGIKKTSEASAQKNNVATEKSIRDLKKKGQAKKTLVLPSQKKINSNGSAAPSKKIPNYYDQLESIENLKALYAHMTKEELKEQIKNNNFIISDGNYIERANSGELDEKELRYLAELMRDNDALQLSYSEQLATELEVELGLVTQ